METLDFRNEDIFLTAITRQKAKLNQIRSLEEFGIKTSNQIHHMETTYGSYTEASFQKSRLTCSCKVLLENLEVGKFHLNLEK